MDVKDECNKYGTVVHTHVDKNSKVGAPLAGYTTCCQSAMNDAECMCGLSRALCT